MQNCWVCGHYIRAVPEEEEENVDVVCPKCLTKHVYTEDEDGNMVVSQAVKSDGTVVHRPLTG